MKPLLRLILIALALPASLRLPLTGLLVSESFARDGDGSGTEGGGRTIDIANRPALRDLNDNTNCTYISLADFLNDPKEFGGVEEFKKILSDLDKIHWYLRYNVEREIQKLTVCQTFAPLVKISAQDADDVALATVKEIDGGDQVGVRLGIKIFLDMTIIGRALPVDQAFIMLHEIFHSFIPMKTAQRNNKLRSFMGAVRKQQLAPMTFDRFALQMEMNSITVPARTRLVTEPTFRKKFEIAALNSPASDLERAVAAGELVDAGLHIFSEDLELIASTKAQAYPMLLSAVKKNDVAQATKLLAAGYSPSETKYKFADLFEPGDRGYSTQERSYRYSYRGSNRWFWAEWFFDSYSSPVGYYTVTKHDDYKLGPQPYVALKGAISKVAVFFRTETGHDAEKPGLPLALHPLLYGRNEMVRALAKSSKEKYNTVLGETLTCVEAINLKKGRGKVGSECYNRNWSLGRMAKELDLNAALAIFQEYGLSKDLGEIDWE